MIMTYGTKPTYGVEEMYSTAGYGLVARMQQCFEKEEAYVAWFYCPIMALDQKSPYELCKEGHQSEIEDLIGQIEHGIID